MNKGLKGIIRYGRNVKGKNHFQTYDGAFEIFGAHLLVCIFGIWWKRHLTK